jgi:hypothetical protein
VQHKMPCRQAFTGAAQAGVARYVKRQQKSKTGVEQIRPRSSTACSWRDRSRGLLKGGWGQFKSFLSNSQLFRFFICFGIIETPKRSETFDTNVLFRIVPKLFSVPVSVV